MVPAAVTLSLAVAALPTLAPRHVDRVLSVLTTVGAAAAVYAWFVLALAVSSFAAVLLLLPVIGAAVFAPSSSHTVYGRVGEPDEVLPPLKANQNSDLPIALVEAAPVDCASVAVCRFRSDCEKRPDLCGCFDGPVNPSPDVSLPVVNGQIVSVKPETVAAALAEFDAMIARAEKSRHRARAEKYRAKRASYVAIFGGVL